MNINYNTVYEYIQEPGTRHYYLFKGEMDEFYIIDLIQYGQPITIMSDRLIDKGSMWFYADLYPLDDYEYRRVMMMVWSGIYEK